MFVPGDVLEMTQKEEERLVKLKYARKVKTVAETKVINPPADEVDPKYYAEAAADLKAAYNRNQLAEAAESVGVEFDPKAKVDDIIDAVIREGKVDELLTDDDEDVER